MSQDPLPPTALTEQALKRLQILANGNGLIADDIKVVASDEKIYELKGETTLKAQCVVESVRHPGPLRNKQAKLLPTSAALHAEADQQKKDLEDQPETWLPRAILELKTSPNEGWGLDGATITLPDKSSTLAATEPCPSCQGQKIIPCAHCNARGYVLCSSCQGRGDEVCPHCYGRGTDPVKTQEKCFMCSGSGYSPCRYCTKLGYPRGQIPCPQCQTKRGAICQTCGGQGCFTDEVSITCAAETRFRLKTSGLPSGLNRALHRVGLFNLGKGHADIETYTPTEKELEEEAENTPKTGVLTVPPSLYYRARVPYADLKLNIKGQLSTASVFGKRAALLGVVPFLDNALNQARQALSLAAHGKAPLTAATKARSIRDAVSLHMQGKDSVNEFRKLYGVGMSADLSTEIMRNAKLALNRTTFLARAVMAFLLAATMLLAFAFFFLTGRHARLSESWPTYRVVMLDFILPVLASFVSWVSLSFGIRLALIKKFPQQKHALMPKTGKTGGVMLAFLLVAYTTLLYMAKPLWLLNLMH